MTGLKTIGRLDFDPDRLAPLLTSMFGHHDGTFAIERISGGQSNPTYYLDWGEGRLVLRKQPNGPILKGAHAVDREYRVLTALQTTPVPVPKPLAFVDEVEALGTPFYLMERVEGRVFSDSSLSALPPPERRPIWLAAADTLAELHKVVPGAVGLSEFGRPGNYFERQINRWTRQYRASPSGPLPELDRVHDWLRNHMPPDDGRIAICHGDFRLGNLMFHSTEPRVVAVLDWELATLGHPMADLGFCCMPWRTAPDEYGGLLGIDLDDMQLPGEQEFVNRYMASFPDAGTLLTFHKVFALYRFAIIFVGIADRASAGTASDPAAARLAPLAKRLAYRALATCSDNEVGGA